MYGHSRRLGDHNQQELRGAEAESTAVPVTSAQHMSLVHSVPGLISLGEALSSPQALLKNAHIGGSHCTQWSPPRCMGLSGGLRAREQVQRNRLEQCHLYLEAWRPPRMHQLGAVTWLWGQLGPEHPGPEGRGGPGVVFPPSSGRKDEE